MRLRLEFGLSGGIEIVSWWGSIKDFPTIVNYKGSKWEWVMYDEDQTKYVNYILKFAEIPSYDPNYWASGTDFEELMKNSYGVKCECGAHYSSFYWDHMRFCPKHVPWSKV